MKRVRRPDLAALSCLAILVAALAAPATALAQLKVSVVSKEGQRPLRARIVMINSGVRSAPYDLTDGPVTINGVTCSPNVSFEVVKHPPFYVPKRGGEPCEGPTTRIELAQIDHYSSLASLMESAGYGESPPWRTPAVIEAETAYSRAVASEDLGEIAVASHRLSTALAGVEQHERAVKFRALAVETASEAISLKLGDRVRGPWLDPVGANFMPSSSAKALLEDFQSRAGLEKTGEWDAATLAAIRRMSSDKAR